ncbi:MAG: hypothetical protein M1833_000334 [Piccolia ochrophora]|nr:MAG: hypothetical protein M1833_000334 [Piccolia ochrophora]
MTEAYVYMMNVQLILLRTRLEAVEKRTGHTPWACAKPQVIDPLHYLSTTSELHKICYNLSTVECTMGSTQSLLECLTEWVDYLQRIAPVNPRETMDCKSQMVRE